MADIETHSRACWVSAAARKPLPYRSVVVRLADGCERVARINVHGHWELAGFRADAHKAQYLGDVAEWFDPDVAGELLEALKEASEYLSSNVPTNGWGLLDHAAYRERNSTLALVTAAIAKATGAAS